MFSEYLLIYFTFLDFLSDRFILSVDARRVLGLFPKVYIVQNHFPVYFLPYFYCQVCIVFEAETVILKYYELFWIFF